MVILTFRHTVRLLHVWVLADLPIPGTSTTLLCDTSTGVARPIIPLAWRRVVFDTIHGLAHPGIRTSRKLVAARFVWCGMA